MTWNCTQDRLVKVPYTFLLTDLDEKHKKLELCNNELEAEINAYMEKITELKTRLSHNKTQELELQTQIQSERAKIEQVKVKVQTCEKALEELDQWAEGKTFSQQE